uniref:Transmembrane protein 177 n=1 Tax=Acrobeloides nanus TaxID=290746 RepID=A0A914DTR8_9BILA
MLRSCARLYLKCKLNSSLSVRNAFSQNSSIQRIRSKLSKTQEGSSANEYWFVTNRGQYIKFGILSATVLIYPFYCYLLDGPFIDSSFKSRYKVTEEFPDHLEQIITEEYNRFLEKEEILPKDAPVKFTLQETTESLDTIARGSVGARTGGRIALPFYARFETKEEAYEYCKMHLEPFMFLNNPVCVIWDSPVGQEIISTLVLTPKAKRFLIARDLYANDSAMNVIARGYHWGLWSLFASVSTLVIGRMAKSVRYSFGRFMIVYTLCNIVAFFGSREMFNSYRYLNDHHGDFESARRSMQHCEGGKEYYTKMLKRNRLLTSIHGKSGLTTPIGDVIGLDTPIFGRYDSLRDAVAEEEEIAPAVQGDDF